MTYEAQEESMEDGRPANLFLFQYNLPAVARYAYTDAEQPQTRDSVVYEPVSIEADAVNASGTLDRKTLNIRVPSSLGIAQLFVGYPPSYPITLIMYQGHLTDNPVEWLAIWSGRVLGGKHDASEGVCELTCQPIATALQRAGLRRRYQYMCPHVLYGNQCKASQAAATSTFAPEAVSASYIDMPSGWATAQELEAYIGGVIVWQTTTGPVIRGILQIENGTRVYLNGPTTELTTQNVSAILGCNHQMDHCADVHNNIQNFGGCPWIPSDQPLGRSKNFYN